jgi:hypothetical protein
MFLNATLNTHAERKRAETNSPRFREGFIDAKRISSVRVTMDFNQKLIQAVKERPFINQIIYNYIKTTLRRSWSGPIFQWVEKILYYCRVYL